MTAPRTPKQAAFIESLLSERLTTLGAANLAEATAKVHLDALSVADAKLIITRLLAMPKDPDPTMPEVVAKAGRSGINNRPGICNTCQGLIDAGAGFYYLLSSGAWGLSHKVGQCTEAPAHVPLATVGEGFYVVEHDEGDPDVYKLYTTRNGHLAAKLLVGEHWEYRTGGVSVVRALVTAGKARELTHEEAAAFGKITGTCIACGLTLSDDGKNKSLEVGYGPICAKRYGWPWGTS
jgi:hypothetical protein